ncbi:hypothetical protein ACUR5C_15760 [Aliikangiella sp. IMCC44653]
MHVDSKSSEKLVKDVITKKTLKHKKLIEVDSYTEELTEIKYSAPGLAERFNNSYDLYSLALELYDLANSGDIEAQYYLAYAIGYCNDPQIPYTHIDSTLSRELHEWIRTRCVGFINQDIEHLGDPKDWIELSAKGKYPPAIVGNLFRYEELERSSAVLNDIQLALSSKKGEVMINIGGLASRETSRITQEAWYFLACDYGWDCSGQSKELWRLQVGVDCSLQALAGQVCESDVDYITYTKSQYTTEEVEQIMTKVEFLRNVIESDRINELTFEQIVD